MNVAILGAGESGIGAALLAVKNKHQVFVSEYGIIKDSYRQELVDNKIDFEESGHSFERLVQADIIIKSPGIPEKAAIIQYLRKADKRIISEIEYASGYCNGQILAITGSNGKTTTSSLLYHILDTAGVDAQLAGNIGNSMARQLATRDSAYWVLELSSFQLDDIHQLQPHVAVLLNITPDHLDRYEYDFNKYAAAKMRICKNQLERDFLVYNSEDVSILAAMQDLKIKSQRRLIAPTTLKNKVQSTDDTLSFEMNLKGKHNVFNAACAVEVARIVGIDEPTIAKALSSFQSIEHRLEIVASVDGVTYINDSKATNVDSVFYALDAMEAPTVWIAGGTDKGNDYEVIRHLVDLHVKAIVCLGVDNEKLITAFSASHKTYATQDIEDAIRQAAEWTSTGDVVLLSPACASFDLFKNYEDRGHQFKNAVWKLIK